MYIAGLSAAGAGNLRPGLIGTYIRVVIWL